METTRRTHELKIAPQYFREIANGNKPFEVRRNDREYQVGDILKLREYDGDYSGQEISAKVTYILDDPAYCKDGYVVMGIKLRIVQEYNSKREQEMKATDWIKSTDALPENRGQMCLLWADGHVYMARFVSDTWGFDLVGEQACITPHPRLYWAAIVPPETK